jgi:membrane-bound lytic murein transglycosylase D
MKKLNILLAFLMLIGNYTIQAQNKVSDDKVITAIDPHGINEHITLPAGMTIRIDSLLHLYFTKNYLKKTPCNSKNISSSFTKEDYIERLKKLPTLIEMPYNDVVRDFINQYSGPMSDRVSYMLGASNFYIPIFEKALETYGLPLELKYLPFIESALDPFASENGKAGLWQLSVSTGKHYGLVINTLVDERRDPIKSSYAAAQYLKDLFNIFDDWDFAITAFHSSPIAVNKAIHRTSGSIDFWSIYPHLSPSARSCVPAFIAMNYIMSNYCDYGICPMNTDLPAKTDTISVTQDMHLQQIADVLGLNMGQLRELNPQYRQDIINGNNAPMSLRLPASFIGNFIDHEDSILKYKTNEFLLKRDETEVSGYNSKFYSRQHRHNRRKNLFTLSNSSNDNGQTISEQNNSDSIKESRNFYKKNRRNRKSRKNVSKSNTRSSRTRNQKKRETDITIKSGDTLSEIAKRNHTTTKKLRQLNGIKDSAIRPGKKLKIK